MLGEDDISLYERLWETVAGRDEDEMSAEHLALYHAEHVNMEVMNGGLVQYFLNTSGEEIDDARAALLTIGATRHAAVFGQAVARWNEERAVPGSCWEKELDDRAYRESRIPELDREWDTDDMIRIELDYARAHAGVT